MGLGIQACQTGRFSCDGRVSLLAVSVLPVMRAAIKVRTRDLFLIAGILVRIWPRYHR